MSDHARRLSEGYSLPLFSHSSGRIGSRILRRLLPTIQSCSVGGSCASSRRAVVGRAAPWQMVLLRPSFPKPPMPWKCRAQLPPTLHHPGVGTWFTLRIHSMPLRVQAVFTGLAPQAETPLSNMPYTGQPPLDPTQREVRFTRICEYANCDQQCASIEGGVRPYLAMMDATLELSQMPVSRACPFDIRIWVPTIQASLNIWRRRRVVDLISSGGTKCGSVPRDGLHPGLQRPPRRLPDRRYALVSMHLLHPIASTASCLPRWCLRIQGHDHGLRTVKMSIV